MRWPHCGIPFVYRRTRIVDVVWVNFTSEVANCIEECQKIESLKLRKAVKETLIRRLPMMTYNMQRTYPLDTVSNFAIQASELQIRSNASVVLNLLDQSISSPQDNFAEPECSSRTSGPEDKQNEEKF